jgi:hypothetical protein
MKNCTTTTDIKTAEVMLQWLKQLRTNIGNIGRVAASRAGTLPPMDDIHTDDDMPQASISRKSHSKTASRSLLDTAAHPKKTATIIQMEQSQVVTMDNSKAEPTSGGKPYKLMITQYSAAPQSTPLFAQYMASTDIICMAAEILKMEKKSQTNTKSSEGLFGLVDKLASPSKSIDTTTSRVYRDRLDMTNTCPATT